MKIEGSGSGSISQRHGSADPDSHQNVMDPEHCLLVRFFSVDGVLLARFFFIDKVLSKVFFSAERALLAGFSIDGVLLAHFFSVEGVRSARIFSDRVLLARFFSVDGVLLERFLSVDLALLIIVAGVLSVELFTDIRSIHSGWSGSFRLLLSSVPDPDPHALGPPGSRSISQRHGSGFGSFYHQTYCFVTSFGLFL
jgi:hypothetical protein